MKKFTIISFSFLLSLFATSAMAHNLIIKLHNSSKNHELYIDQPIVTPGADNKSTYFFTGDSVRETGNFLWDNVQTKSTKIVVIDELGSTFIPCVFGQINVKKDTFVLSNFDSNVSTGNYSCNYRYTFKRGFLQPSELTIDVVITDKK